MKRLSPDHLIVVGSLLIFLVAAFLSSEKPGTNPLPSSYNSDPAGTRAAYLLTGSLGYQVERWEESVAGLARYGEGTTFFVAGPARWSPTESEELTAFAQRGGRVVIFSSLPYAWLFTGQLELRPDPQAFLLEPDATLLAYPQALGSATAGIRAISVRPITSWGSHKGVAWLGHDRGAVVVGWRVGKGTIYAVSDLYCVSNEGLAEEDNLLLLLNLLGSPAPHRGGTGPEKAGRIFFDEYHHGYGGGLGRFLAKTPVPRMALQIGFMLLLLAYSGARRFGPLRPLPVPDRRSPLEFVETMGELYRHGRAPVAALEPNYLRFQQELSRRLGLPPDASSRTVVQLAAERLRLPPDELADLIRWCEAERANPHSDEEETYRRILEIHRVMHEMRGHRTSSQAKRG